LGNAGRPISTISPLLPHGRFIHSEEIILIQHANGNVRPAKQLSYRELSDARGITHSRRHLYPRQLPAPLGEPHGRSEKREDELREMVHADLHLYSRPRVMLSRFLRLRREKKRRLAWQKQSSS